MHLAAPRVLQHKHNCSKGPVVNKSTLAGWPQAIPHTRAYLNDDMRQVNDSTEGVHTRVYIDVMGMHGSETTNTVTNIMVGAGETFANGVSHSRLRRSGKLVAIVAKQAAMKRIKH